MERLKKYCDRAARVADAIESRSVKHLAFDMAHFAAPIYHPDELRHPRKDAGCKTSACMAGWTVAICDRVGIERLTYTVIRFRAGDLLGLTHEESVLLFASPEFDFTKVSDAIAVRALRRFAQGWSVRQIHDMMKDAVDRERAAARPARRSSGNSP